MYRQLIGRNAPTRSQICFFLALAALLIVPAAWAVDGLPRLTVTAVTAPGSGLSQVNGAFPECTEQPISCNSSVNGTLGSGDCAGNDERLADLFEFQGMNGQTITADLTMNDNDAFLSLLDAGGNEVATDDDGGGDFNARISQQLNATGSWFLGVSTFDDGSPETATYTLTLACSGVGVVPAAPSNLSATALSSSEIQITWNDNSNNEDEFQVEVRQTGGAFGDVGAVGANTTAATISGFPPNTTVDIRIRARNASGNSGYSNIATATTHGGGGGGTCVPSATVLCLNNNRFRVETEWRRPDNTTGVGTGVELTGDTGYFWFFSPSNVEMVVKVLNGCPTAFNSYWVFAGGLTNVEVTMTVTDVQSGQVRTYTNPLRTPFQPLQDTEAFATCP